MRRKLCWIALVLDVVLFAVGITYLTRTVEHRSESLSLSVPMPELWTLPTTTTTTEEVTTTTVAPTTTTTQRASRGAPRTTINLLALRWCENRKQCEQGNCYISDPDDHYRGGYQFDQLTWESVGGTGDPADASPEEQDMRAEMLYERSGIGPWPVCGRHLYDAA